MFLSILLKVQVATSRCTWRGVTRRCLLLLQLTDQTQSSMGDISYYNKSSPCTCYDITKQIVVPEVLLEILSQT